MVCIYFLQFAARFNLEIFRGLQVTALSDKLLSATRRLEDMITDLKDISSTLHIITEKISTQQKLQHEDWNVLTASENWFNANHMVGFLLKEKADVTTRHPVLSLSKLPLYDCTDTHFIIKADVDSTSTDFVKGLDEVHDLDWDCEGIQLHSPVSNTVIPFSPTETDSDLSPLDTAGNTDIISSLMFSSKYSGSVSSLSSSCTYLGLYEEAMELTLELEEGFYSEDEDFFDVNREKLLNQRSSSTNISSHSIDGDVLQLSPCSPCEYKFVDIDDDMQSVSSDFYSDSLSHDLKNESTSLKNSKDS